MQLSADQMRVLTATLRMRDDETTETERRRTGRLDVNATVAVTPLKDGERGEPLMLRLHDLSPRGVALLHTMAFEDGQQFILELPRDPGPAVAILCTTVHTRSGGGRLHKIGAEFTCALSDLPAEPTTTDAEQDRIRQSVLD